MEDTAKRDIKGRFVKGQHYNLRSDLHAMKFELIPCECNCGELIPKLDAKLRPRHFKNGHVLNNSGRFKPGHKMELETRNKISEAMKGKLTGSNCPSWKGDDVKDRALHRWVRKCFPMPEQCQECQKIGRLDLANITGLYNRELKNWKYLCRQCHTALDGNAYKAWITRKKKRSGF